MWTNMGHSDLPWRAGRRAGSFFKVEKTMQVTMEKQFFVHYMPHLFLGQQLPLLSQAGSGPAFEVKVSNITP